MAAGATREVAHDEAYARETSHWGTVVTWRLGNVEVFRSALLAGPPVFVLHCVLLTTFGKRAAQRYNEYNAVSSRHFRFVKPK